MARTDDCEEDAATEQDAATSEDAPWAALDGDAKEMFRALHRRVWEESAAPQGPQTLRSILVVLANSTAEQLENLICLYEGASSPARSGEVGSSSEEAARVPVGADPRSAATAGPGPGAGPEATAACYAASPIQMPLSAQEGTSLWVDPQLAAILFKGHKDPAVLTKGDRMRLDLLAQVRIRSTALRDAPKWMREDREFALAAVQVNGHALAYVSEALRRDQEVVLAAVSKQGNALRFASLERRKDRACVLAAVANDGNALGYAPDEMRKDSEIALAAIEKNSHALNQVSADLWRDREFVLAVVRQRGNSALRFLSPGLRNDPQVKLVAKSGSRLQGAPPSSEQSRN